MKKEVLLVGVLILFLLSFSSVGGQNDPQGCCANIEFQFAYCEGDSKGLLQSECCPDESDNYGDDHFPANKADCEANFFKVGSCQGLNKCEKGCCFDPSSPVSQQCNTPTTEDLCLINDPAQGKVPLFGLSPSGVPLGGSFCYSLQNGVDVVKKFDDCPDKSQNTITCSDLNGDRDGCSDSICSYCVSTGQCLSDCGGCPQTNDNNNDGECDGGVAPPLDCTDIVGEQACKQNGCKFCPNGQGSCNSNCNTCIGNQRDGNSDDVCDDEKVSIFCSELTTQDECINSDLGCFFCDSPLGGTSNCRPSSFKCSSCGDNLDSNQDKVCDSLGTSPCKDGIDNDADGKIDTVDFCCDDKEDLTEDNSCFCPSSQVCNEYGLQQCIDGGGIRVNIKEYDNPSSNHICCSTSCFMPSCPKNVVVSTFNPENVQTISGTPYNEDFCSCGNEIVDTSTDDRFCCELGDGTKNLQSEPCKTIKIRGKIVNKEDGKSLPGRVKFFNKQKRLNFEIDTNIIKKIGDQIIREYFIEVAQGEVYDAEGKTTLDGFGVSQKKLDTSQLSAGSEINFDFEVGKVDSNCVTNFPKPIIEVNQEKCEKEITLEWEPFACSTVQYKVLRSESSSGGGSVIASLGSQTLTFVDTTTEFGKTYFYTLQVVLSDSSLNQGQALKSDPVSVFAGDQVCIETCPLQTFCTSNNQDEQTLISRCDEENKLIESDCEGLLGQGALCLDVRKNGDPQNAVCKFRDSCKDIGVAFNDNVAFPNILGMFYSFKPDIKTNLCLGSESNKKYCYFDSFDGLGIDSDITQGDFTNPLATTVDRCVSCDPGLTCFDYKSKLACEQDNCIVSGSGDCQWEQSIENQGELGNGICFDINDKGTKNCDVCQGEGLCTDAVCTKLGGCISNDDTSGCNACALPSKTELNPTTCEDYQTEKTCIGNQAFSIDGVEISNSIDKFKDSQDHCGLKVCKWDGNKCFKDGDDNSNKDCINNKLCESDTARPVTTISAPVFLSTTTDNTVTFLINDITYGNIEQVRLFFCAGLDDNCRPEVQRIAQKVEDGKFSFTTALPLIDETDKKPYFVRFFSIDGYDNIEPIQTKTLEIDTVLPIITIKNVVDTPNFQDSTKTDISLDIEVNEFSICDIDLVALGLTDTSLSGFPQNGIVIDEDNPFTLNKEELEDGIYQVNVECKDNFLNLAQGESSFILDTNKQITSVSPFDEILSENTINLEIETLNDQFGKGFYDCSFEVDEGITQKFGVPSNPNAPIGTDFKYSADLNLQDGFHTVSIECEDTTVAPPELIDKTTTIFSIDTSVPDVSIIYETLDGFADFTPNDLYVGDTILRFDCDDNLADFKNLGPLGCVPNDVRFCFGTEERKCDIDPADVNQQFDPNDINSLPRLTQTGFLCYAVTDSVNNNFDSPICNFINVDNDIPQLTNIRVNNELYDLGDINELIVVKDQNIKVTGNWKDRFGEVDITLNEKTLSETDPFGEGKFIFSPVELDTKANIPQLFSLSAKDTAAINGHNVISPPFSLRIAYDKFSPVLSSVKILNEDDIAIQSATKEGLVSKGVNEYLTNLSWNLRITDPKFTESIVKESARIEIALVDGGLGQTGCLTKFKSTLESKPENVFTGNLNGCLEMGDYSAKFTAQDVLGNVGTREVFFKVRDTTPNEVNITVFEKDSTNNVSIVSAGQDNINRYDVVLNSPDPLDFISSLNLTFTDITQEFRRKQIAMFPEDSTGKRFKGELIVVRGGIFTRLDGVEGQFAISVFDKNGVESTADQIDRGKSLFIDTFGPKDAPQFFTLDDEGVVFTNDKSFLVSGHEFKDNPKVGIQLKFTNDDSVQSIATATVIELITEDSPVFIKPFMTKLGIDELDEQIISFTENSLTVFDPLNRFDEVGHYFNFTEPQRRSGKNYLIKGIDKFSSDLKKVTYTPNIEGNINSFKGPIYIQDKEEPGGWFGTNINLELGDNFFLAAARDGLGNLGKFSIVHRLVFEDRKPVFSDENPRDGAVISENKTLISIEVENKTQLKEFFMKIDDNDAFVPVLLEEDEKTKFVHQINEVNGLSEGVYTISVNATDVAGNTEKFSWVFQIDVDVPNAPIIIPTGFTDDNTPELIVEFANNDDINLLNATLFDEVAQTDLTTLLRGAKVAPHKFVQELAGPLQDGKYEVFLKADKVKSLVGGVFAFSNTGIFPKNEFIVDTLDPKINVSTLASTNQRHVFIEVNVSEINFLRANITANSLDIENEIFSGIPLKEDAKSGTLRNGNFRINFSNTNEEIKEIIITAFDKAGNEQAARAAVRFDNTSPEVNVIITSPVLINNVFTKETIISGGCACDDSGSGCDSSTEQVFMSIDKGPFVDLKEIPVANKNVLVTLRCSVNDFAGNQGIGLRNITIVREGPLIEVTKPKFGGTAVRITPIEILTDTPSDCTIHQFIDSAPSGKFFPLNDEKTKLLSSLDLGSAFGDVPKTAEYFIKCKNAFGFETVAKEELVVDTRPLEIIDASLGKGNFVTDNLLNTLKVETNLDSICKFAVRQQKIPPSIPIEALPFSFGENFVKKNTFEHNFGRNGKFNVYVDCFDKTEKTVSKGKGYIFDVEFDVDFPIEIDPDGVGILSDEQKKTLKKGREFFTIDTTPVLFVTTNKISLIGGEEGCTFKEGIFPAKLSTEKEERFDDEERLEYVYKLPITSQLNDKLHEFDITCQSGFDASTTTLSFTVDTTKPDKPELNDIQNAIRVKKDTFIINTNISLIGTVNEDSQVDILVNNDIFDIVNTTEKFFEGFVDINEFEHKDVLLIKARAVDKLGNGPSEDSDTITVTLDLESEKPLLNEIPEFTNTGKIRINGSSESNALIKVFTGAKEDETFFLTDGQADENGIFNFDISGLPLGTNFIQVSVVDTLGNKESEKSEARKIIFDVKKPQMIKKFPQGGDILPDKILTIHYEIRDNFGIDSESLSLSLNDELIAKNKIDVKEDKEKGLINISTSITFTTRGQQKLELTLTDLAGNGVDSSITSFSVNFAPACIDEIDNDGDGKIDQGEDLGCCGVEDDDETDFTGTNTECSDSIDNEGDGKIDYCFDGAICDKDCSCKTDDFEGITPTECNDGVDNDNDGFIDFCFENTCDNGCDSADDNNETDFVSAPSLLRFTLNGEEKTFSNTKNPEIGIEFNKGVKIEQIDLDTIAQSGFQNKLVTEDNIQFVFTPTLTDQQEHTITVRASTTGGETQRSFTFTVDSIKPTIDINDGIDTTINRRDAVDVFGTFNEKFLSSIVLIELLLPDEINGDVNPQTFASKVNLPKGEKINVKAEITDLAGNVGEDEISFIIEEALPRLELNPLPERTNSLPLRVSGITEPNFEFEVSVNENVLKVKSDGQGVFFKDIGIAEGLVDQVTNKINVSVINGFEARNEVLKDVIVDLQSPIILNQKPGDTDRGNFNLFEVIFEDISNINFKSLKVFNNNEAFDVKVDSTQNKISASLEGIFKGIPIPLNIKIILEDELGNELNEEYSFTLDNGPIITFLDPTDDEKFVNSTVPFIKVKFDNFDAGSVRSKLFDSEGIPLDLITIPLTANQFLFNPLFALNEGGSYFIQLKATRDFLGQTIVTKEIVVDTIRPLLFINKKVIANPSNKSSLSLQGRFEELHPKEIRYRVESEQGTLIDSGEIGFETFSNNQGRLLAKEIFLGNQDKPVTIIVILEDLAGNKDEDRITLDLDRKVPLVTIIDPQDGFISAKDNVFVKAKSNEKSELIVEVNNEIIDQGILVDIQEEVDLAVGLTQSGINLVKIKARDEAGNIGEDEIIIKLDDTAPVISNVQPSNPIAVIRPKISGEVRDDNGIANISVLVDSIEEFFSPIPKGTTFEDFIFTITKDLSDKKFHTLLVRAFDNLGNMGISEPIQFLVDTSLPNLLNIFPGEEEVIAKVSALELLFEQKVTLSNGILNGKAISFTTTDDNLFVHTILAGETQEERNKISFDAKRNDGIGGVLTQKNTFIIDSRVPRVSIEGIVESNDDKPVLTTLDVTLIVNFADEHMQSLVIEGGVSREEINFVDKPDAQEKNTNLKVPLTLLPGKNEIVATATDRGGNINNSIFTVFVDRELPPLDLDPLPGQTNELPIKISGVTLADHDVFIIVNGKKNTIASGGKGLFTFEATKSKGIIDEFTNIINVSVAKSGDLQTEIIKSVKVDTQGPDIIQKSPDQSDRGNFKQIEIFVDDFIGVDFSSAALTNNKFPLDVSFDPDKKVIRSSLAGFFKGVPIELKLLLTVQDILGNEIEEDWEVILDDGPLITFLNPGEGVNHVNSTIPFLSFRVDQFDKESVVARLIEDTGAPIEIIPIIKNNVFTFFPRNDLIPGKQYTLEVSANRSTISQTKASKEFVVDTTKPSVFINKNNLVQTNAFFVDITGSFTEENAELLRFIVKGSDNQIIDSGELTFEKINVNEGIFLGEDVKTGTKEQEITIEVIIEDKAGNIDKDSASFVIDRTVPIVTLNEPANDLRTANPTLFLQGLVDEDSIVEILVNNKLISNENRKKGDTFTEKITLVNQGDTIITVNATDVAGNTGTAQLTIFFDKIGPLVENLKPNNPVNTQTPKITFTLLDSEGVKNFTVLLDDKEIFTSDVPGSAKEFSFSQEVPSVLKDNEFHFLRVIASDVHGNTGLSKTEQFLVDTSIPGFASSVPKDNEQIKENKPTLIVTFEEDIDMITALLNNKAVAFTRVNSKSFSHSVQDALDDKENILLVTVKRSNGVGNEHERSVSFIVDTKKPKLNIKGLENINENLINTKENTLVFSFADEHMSSLNLIGTQNSFTESILDGPGIESNPNKKIKAVLLEGINKIGIDAQDQAGNINTSSIIVELDTIGSVITSVNVLNSIVVQPNTIFKSGTSLISLTGTYSENPVKKISIGQSKAILNEQSKSFIITDILLEGVVNQEIENEIVIVIEDKAGNVEEKKITVFNDQLGPFVTLLDPKTNGSLNRRPTFTITTSEPGLGCIFRYTPGSLQREEFFKSRGDGSFELTPSFQLDIGENPIVIQCSDTLGNKGSPLLLNMFIEKPLPEGKPTIIEINPVDSVPLEEENRYLLFRLNANNQAETALSIQAEDNSGGVRCTYGTFENNLFLKTAGFDDFNFSLNPVSNMFTVPLGNTDYFVQCEDRAGKQSDIFKIGLTVDPNFPVVIKQVTPSKGFVNNIDGDFNEIIEISTLQMDTECSIDFIGKGIGDQKMIPIQVNGENHHRIDSKDTDSGLLEDNTTYTYEIECDDLGANLQSSKKNIIFTTDYSMEAPLITKPTNESSIIDEIIVEGTVESDSTVQLLVNDILIKEQSLPNSRDFSFANVLLRSGDNTILIKATDKAGNTASVSKDVFFSSLGPGVKIIIPRNGQLIGALGEVIGKVNSDISVDLSSSTITVTGPNGLEKGGIKSIRGESGEIKLRFEPQIEENGEYIIEINGVDSQGRTSRNTSKVTVNRNLPLVEILQPNPAKGTVTTQQQIRVSGKIKSRVDIDPKVLLTNSQSADAVPLPPLGEFKLFGFNFSGFRLTEGVNAFNVSVKNTFGITGVGEGDVTLDTTGPEALITIE